MDICLLNRGQTLLHQFIAYFDESSRIRVIDNLTDVTDAEVLVGLYDYFDYNFERGVVEYCRDNHIPYVRANLIFEQAVVGPVYNGRMSSCVDCLYERLSTNAPDDAMVLYRDYDYTTTSPAMTWRISFLNQICEEVVELLRRVEVEEKSALNHITILNDEKRSIHIHPLLKHEYCQSCGELPSDTEQHAMLQFQPRIKESPTTYRLKSSLSPTGFKQRLVDLKTGKTKHSYFEVESKYVPMVGTENYIETDKNEGAFGRTFDFKSSEVSAYLEGLERYSNVYNRKSNSEIFASYLEVKDRAVNPADMTLHKEEHMNEHFRLHRYSENMKYHWVWGCSLRNEVPLLIPEQMVYYKDEMIRGESRRFVYETSNGCALGSTIEEAVLYGLFEMIERDNFLVAWYNRLPLVEIDISNMSEEFRILNEVIKADGYEVRFFDTTMELGIPTVWALMVNERDDAVVKTYSAAGCHFNPEKALMSAFIEVVSSVPVYNKVFGAEHLMERKRLIFENDDLATEFQDHVLLYSHPDALERLSFLTSLGEKKTLRTLHPEWYETETFKNQDLTEDLNQLLHRIYKHYEDVYVVDLSGDLLKSFELRCVKVFIPGMLTMTFGHQHRRLDESRILQAPVLAGRVDSPLAMDNINPYPHPFP